MELVVVIVFATLLSNVIAQGKYGPWPHDPRRTRTITVTTTEKVPPICNCPLERNVTKTVPEKCFCPLETIITTTLTKNIPAHCSANLTVISCTGSSNATTTSTGGVQPTCGLTKFPERFFIKDTTGRYLSVGSGSHKAQAILGQSHATVFHVAFVDYDSINNVPQLAFDATSLDSDSTVEYRAFVHTSGGPVRFFSGIVGPDFDTKFEIVTPAFGQYLCQIQLFGWVNHELKYPEDCGGALWMDYGQPNGGCERVVLTVVPA